MDSFAIYTTRTKIKAGAVLILAALLLVLGLDFSGVLTPYRLKTLDLLFRQAPLPKASPQVVVVTVDQPDLDFFKAQGVTWPWPRQIYAPLIDFCRRSGAQAVIFDILYTEASSYGPDDDRRFAEAAAAAGNVIFPFFLSREDKPSSPGTTELLDKAALAISGTPPPESIKYRSLLAPIPPLVAAARTLGNVQSPPDIDGIYRRIPLVLPFQGRWLPLLAFAAFQSFDQEAPWRFQDGALVQGDRRIPLDAQGQFLLKYRGPTRSHQRFSAANLIQSEYRLLHGHPSLVPPEALAGKWVFVGLTAPGLFDLKASPVSAIYPGVEVHATLLDNLLQGDFLKTVPAWLWWAWTLVLVGSMVLTVLFVSGMSGLIANLGALVIFNALHVALCVFAFTRSWYADPLLPDLALNFSFALAAVYSYATEGRQKHAIRGMFAQYMSEVVINHLLEHPEKLKLGGERRRITIFFSDLAGFTTLSERLDPEKVVALLNDYLSRMTDIILEEDGMVDKFEGDAIMAFWGAPLDQEDQAVLTCRAALRQAAALQDLNRQFADRGLPRLNLRMGLHTGEAIVGNLGSQKRFDYTAIGDSVNLASRLEGLNKFYGTPIMASEATVQECRDLVEFRELDWVAVKGRAAPVTVYEVLALKGELTPEQAAGREEFARGLQLFREKAFSRAEPAFAAVLEHLPEDGPAPMFIDLCRKFQESPPPSDWDGVFRPDKK
ncbi:MAG: adenylate/guanylate cyclase domain-containing protein [Deltaproteobacteria bacterium]|nr:adenylate/guanylate cyclase domain-containing protein [Deltaproteobacteria bacterium]